MTPVSFEQLARLPEDELEIALALGAALVARDAYDTLDVGALLAELEALGGPVSAEAGALRDRVAAVSERFVKLGFHGNTEDYYDPRNSLLPDVLARKTGIPITLSIVWCAMAKTAGLHARGVAFPGHFLVRVDETAQGSEAPVVIDPFQGGRIVDDLAATALLRRALGDGTELHPSLFAPASARATLVRLLTNLQSTYAKRGEHARAFIAVDRIVTLVPDSARMLRERGALALRIGATEVARADFTRVVELEPHAPDIPQIEARLRSLVTPPWAILH